jgi:ferrous iron transport protein B
VKIVKISCEEEVKIMIFALIGNQNCGKSTLFNRLTASNQRVGNFAGVTVEQKYGKLLGYPGISVVDLPGVYSLSALSGDEAVVGDFLRGTKPDLLINILDASNLERGLFLTLQLTELGIPMLLALNMMDEVEANAGEIDISRMSEVLGIPITGISASKNRGLSELSEQAVLTAQSRTKPPAIPLGSVNSRYRFIEQICTAFVQIPQESRQYRLSYRVDTVLTHRIWGIPIFIAVMLIVFRLTFNVIGTPLSELFKSLIGGLGEKVSDKLLHYGVNPAAHSLITDGIFAGIGVIVGFLPIIITLFFFLSLLQDSGYMARVAFITDSPLRKIGLSGKSFVPLLMGFGCTVPAVMATRTLPSRRDRVSTVLLLPFMSCSAKIPVYVLFTAVFFSNRQALVIMSLYLLGIVGGAVSALLSRKLLGGGDCSAFLLELPDYRLPTLRNTLMLLWDKARDFVSRAFTVILVAVIVIWFLQSYDLRMNYVAGGDTSMLAWLGQGLAVVFAPLGFSDWRITAALVTGFVAKEAVIGTLAVSGCSVQDSFTTVSAFSFLTFTLLYVPCCAAVAAIKREFASVKATLFLVLYQTGFAWLMACAVYQIGSRLF